LFDVILADFRKASQSNFSIGSVTWQGNSELALYGKNPWICQTELRRLRCPLHIHCLLPRKSKILTKSISLFLMESTRKKSCRQCRLAKTRCSLDVPHCTRCSRRNLHCKYDRLVRNPNNALGDGSLLHSWSVAPYGTLQSPEACQGSPARAVPGPTAADSRSASVPGQLDFNQSQIVDLEHDPYMGMSWNNEGANWPNNVGMLEAEENVIGCDQSRILDPLEQDFQDGITLFEFISGTTARNIEESRDLLFKVSLAMNRGSNVFQARWHAFSDARNGVPNLLSRNPNTKLSSLLIGNHLWATLESFAVRFCDGLLPPFIHNSSRPENAEGHFMTLADLPGALANCQSIVQMYLSKTPGNTALVLRTLLLEVQRLHGEVSDRTVSEK
jgi:hypothetical protein